MRKEIQIRVSPEVAGQEEELRRYLLKELSLGPDALTGIEVIHRSIDARQRKILVQLSLRLFIDEPFTPNLLQTPSTKSVSAKKPVHIIGFGPAGLFAALQLIQNNRKPIVWERGKDVKARVEDLRGINVHQKVNPDSNYCFGEGGAGTYSDGKLYTRSTKRGNVKKILESLVQFGANPNILVDAHPHIGTNKLPQIIKNMREYILACGGEIHFEQRVTDFEIRNQSLRSFTVSNGMKIEADECILATGHSARDIFEILKNKNIKIELKPLAIGVRVEHPQALIDQIQYKCDTRSPYLPPAPYSLVKQIQDRGVYSFCMCPGGVIAPCATADEEVVTNGWSSSARGRPTANSGIVVELNVGDFKDFSSYGELASMYFQKSIETKAWIAGGKTQRVPAQRLEDFIQNKISASLPKTSYTPGIVSFPLKEIFPKIIYESLVNGFKQFETSMKGYLTNDAIVHAPETRTSSPIRIPRDPQTCSHVEVQGLYPCGEGAGYAGGIVSAALDGMKVANAISGIYV
ncbi:NAD(P)/FAD-dependent oxidoreductase [Leptospira ryugenii]|uniref:NAD(P)/FAD-dependent oxidoreductase n=1 Tax=Leptospira ryugenii TaxID=1917863 RepID=UPI000D59D430|nr:FAD-binding protein [Leptospira ryugenii]